MKPLIAANWKMNKDRTESKAFVDKFMRLISKNNSSEIVLCVPFTSLCALGTMLENSRIKLGAQNMNFEEQGAYTGEISASMLKGVEAEYVILGHSERRQYFNETNELINKKIKSALKNKLKPILCIGETLEQRNNNKTIDVIKNQLINCLKNIKEMRNVVIAYEPIWAIGTGKNATPQQAEEVHKSIRELLSKMYNKNIAENTRIIYGGSVKESNIKDLMQMRNINGALVGSASLDAKSFGRICGVKI